MEKFIQEILQSYIFLSKQKKNVGNISAKSNCSLRSKEWINKCKNA